MLTLVESSSIARIAYTNGNVVPNRDFFLNANRSAAKAEIVGQEEKNSFHKSCNLINIQYIGKKNRWLVRSNELILPFFNYMIFFIAKKKKKNSSLIYNPNIESKRDSERASQIEGNDGRKLKIRK